MKELVLGSGNKVVKFVTTQNRKEFENPTTLDINPDCNPDVVWDLNDRPLPFKDEEFDEIHAYEVLEHIGTQGDYERFFEEFYEYWRILKPGGRLVGSCPKWNSPWAWGDPSHTRIISAETVTFLNQAEYEEQVGNTAMSDFRRLWKGDFRLQYSKNSGESWFFVLEKF